MLPIFNEGTGQWERQVNQEVSLPREDLTPRSAQRGRENPQHLGGPPFWLPGLNSKKNRIKLRKKKITINIYAASSAVCQKPCYRFDEYSFMTGI